MKRSVPFVLVAALVGCGGGGTVDQLQSPQAAAVAQSTFTLDADTLMNWAEGRYPSLFPGHQADAYQAPYLYRRYPTTGNYLGVTGDDIYILGPVSGGTLTKVGSLSAFACQVYPNCLFPGTTGSPGPTVSSANVTLSWSSTPGARFYYLELVSGNSVVVRGNITGTSYPVNLTPGRQYSWFVNPCDGDPAVYRVGGCSANSSTFYFQTPASTGFISFGGLTWAPVTFTSANWQAASAYCTGTTINGQTGWRMPTYNELLNLATNAGRLSAYGWVVSYTWTGTQAGAGYHSFIDLEYGTGFGVLDSNPGFYVSCVR